MSKIMSEASRAIVYVTRNIPVPALQMLQDKLDVRSWQKDEQAVPRDVLKEQIRPAQALFCLLTDRIDKEILDAGPNLKVVGTMSVGSDHIDLGECQKRGIKVGYTPEVLTEATAELTIGLLLATSRKLMCAAKTVPNGEWGTWSPLWMCGKGLAGSTVGIFGMGRIGQSVAEKLVPFRPKNILYNSNTAKSKIDSKLGTKFVDWSTLLRESDFLIACCPLNAQTAMKFNAEAFKQMKPDSIFINTSRGGVVDQSALAHALERGVIGAAGLDVTTPEPLPCDSALLKLPNAVILPHIGSATVATRTEMATLTARNILAGLNGESMPAPLC